MTRIVKSHFEIKRLHDPQAPALEEFAQYVRVMSDWRNFAELWVFVAYRVIAVRIGRNDRFEGTR